MKQIFKYLNTCKKETILTPIFVLLEVIFEILIPILMGKMIDDGIKLGDITLVYRYGALMIVFAFLSLVFGVLATKTASTAASQLARNLRKAQYEKIQTYSFENIDHFQTSSLITRMTMDVNMVQQAFQMNIRIAFRAPMLLVFSIVSAAFVGGKIALVFVTIIPILGFGLWFIMSRAHKHFMKMFKKVDNLNLKVQEDLAGIRTIKSYVREEYENKEFEEISRDVSENSKRAEKWIIFNNPLMQFSIAVCFVLISWFGAKAMVNNTLTDGAFSNIIIYVMQVLVSLMMLSQVFLMLVISRASVERITEVLNEVPSIKESKNPIKEIKSGAFEFINVDFKYNSNDEKDILKNINFSIPSGAFVGIFGGTGTGKTSLVQLISRLYDVSDGKVLVDGNDVRDYDLNVLRENVVTVLQKNVLFSGTIRDNIKWGKEDATDEEIIDALKKSQAYEFVSQMHDGLDTWIDQGGVNVSGGQRQRLCIARALISNPKILILDDSTSAVDTKTDALIRDSLKNESPLMTKVVVSQRLSSIEDADYIIILDENGINAIGNHETLFKENQIYHDVYITQKRGKEE
ncbi:ABC transporter ATP-binding protein [Haploplasma axanthum]|uniref:ABC-type multidrug/protein/lipid transport system ATPase component n=1 Tax=Haploplasma axanthum TaxID=29552 RepID=A0A449BEY7_HAPAX|nr:ABC transporter ATP-binding protein [Haploplasma axanthum]VEU81023.1 ABC-type multidrug/protein/lipid transport system ATPase component [Haploplasma axanthum]